MTPDDKEWLEQAMLEVKEGTATPEVVNYLQKLLLKDPEARSLYLQYNQMDALLENSAAEESNLLTSITQRRPYLMGGLIGAGIAAAITFLLTFTLVKEEKPTNTLTQTGSPTLAAPPIATIGSSLDASFASNFNLDGIETGEFGLEEGIAQLDFRNGAEIVLDGHCNFEILNENHLVLHHGRVWAYCPPQAHGFTITTPDGKDIVDIGTEFAVEVSDNGETHLQVFEGIVEIHSPDKSVEVLRKNHAVTWTSGGRSQKANFIDPTQFITSKTIAEKRFQSYRESLLARQDLLLYYDFGEYGSGEIKNLAVNAPPQSNALLEGALYSRGRTDNSVSLLFPRESSQASFSLQSTSPLHQFTTVMWIKADSFNSHHMALLTSDDWKPGSFHLQIYRDGSLESSLFDGSHARTSSQSIQLGQWHQIATTWDLKRQRVSIYCDGQKLKTWSNNPREMKEWAVGSPNLSQMTLGHWHPGEFNDPYPRNFLGSIGEVLIFRYALNQSEINELYQQGRP